MFVAYQRTVNSLSRHQWALVLSIVAEITTVNLGEACCKVEVQVRRKAGLVRIEGCGEYRGCVTRPLGISAVSRHLRYFFYTTKTWGIEGVFGCPLPAAAIIQ